jgi:hypothetical protein
VGKKADGRHKISMGSSPTFGMAMLSSHKFTSRKGETNAHTSVRELANTRVCRNKNKVQAGIRPALKHHDGSRMCRHSECVHPCTVVARGLCHDPCTTNNCSNQVATSLLLASASHNVS